MAQRETTKYQRIMRKIIALSVVLGVLTVGQTMAQETSATKVGKQEMSGPGVKKRGTGKVGPEATQNGNMNPSDTRVKFTEGSTSQGTASVPSPGGAKGTNVQVKRERNTATSTESTLGKTGSQRPTSTAAVEKEARTSDKNVSTGYPQPTSLKQPGNAMSPRQKVRANTTRGMGQRPDPKPANN